MTSKFKHDIFISYADQDIERIKGIRKRLKTFAVEVSWDRRKRKHGVESPDHPHTQLLNSRHFVLLCSEPAQSSQRVNQQCDIFWSKCHKKDKDNRRMFVLSDGSCTKNCNHAKIQNFHNCTSEDELITTLLEALVIGLRSDLTSSENQLEAEVKKVAEVQLYLRDSRFWDNLGVNNRPLNIFTCGRDVDQPPEMGRGYGGRTNIDVWDYRSVLDITHYFARRFPNIKLKFEEPRSKLNIEELRKAGRLDEQIEQIQDELRDKDCIVVGSPDVNDYAEVLISTMHGIDPYTKGRKKKMGFAIIKKLELTTSSFYWQIKENEQEGIALIREGQTDTYFPHKRAENPADTGEMHGVLVIGNNPFSNPSSKRKVVVLSGFSGVATNAIAKLLTDNNHAGEYLKFGKRFIFFSKNVEILVKVEYKIGDSSMDKDTRSIENITLERFIELPEVD